MKLWTKIVIPLAVPSSSLCPRQVTKRREWRRTPTHRLDEGDIPNAIDYAGQTNAFLKGRE
jgi:hypothetical protein